MDELSQFWQVVYAYSDCSERFQMDPRLDEEARTRAVIARSYGLVSYSIARPKRSSSTAGLSSASQLRTGVLLSD